MKVFMLDTISSIYVCKQIFSHQNIVLHCLFRALNLSNSIQARRPLKLFDLTYGFKRGIRVLILVFRSMGA